MARFRLPSILLVPVLACIGCQPSPAPQPSTEREAPPAAVERPAPGPERGAATAVDEVAAWAEKSGAEVKTDGEGRIVVIDFTQATITDDHLHYLAGQEYLKELRLGGCPIGDAAL